MIPLAVTAHLAGGIALPSGALALDALLMAAVALRDGLPPLSIGQERPEISIPIEKEPRGRFHLASFAVADWEEHELRYVNKRFPVAEAQALAGPKFRRIQITAGPCKSHRIPMETGHLRGDALRWWCLGEAEPIRDLLGLVSHLGKRRGVGLGRVAEWHVEPAEPWPGFPILRDGLPLRYLPPDWPGLASPPPLGYAVLSPPYWERMREELCAVPEAMP